MLLTLLLSPQNKCISLPKWHSLSASWWVKAPGVKRLGLNRNASSSILAPSPRKAVRLYSFYYLAQSQRIYYLLIESCCQIQFEWSFLELTSLLTLSIVVKTQTASNILLPLDCFLESTIRGSSKGKQLRHPFWRLLMCIWRKAVLFDGACSFRREEGDTRLVSHISRINPGDQ